MAALLNKYLSFRVDRVPSLVKSQDGNQISLMLQIRFISCQTIVYRPLFFYCLHKPADAPHMSSVIPYAQRVLDIIIELLYHMDRHGRHGGTWFLARGSWHSGMLILAAVIGGRGKLKISPDWKEHVRSAMRTLARWSKDARDLQRMHEVLTLLFQETCRLTDRQPDH